MSRDEAKSPVLVPEPVPATPADTPPDNVGNKRVPFQFAAGYLAVQQPLPNNKSKTWFGVELDPKYPNVPTPLVKDGKRVRATLYCDQFDMGSLASFLRRRYIRKADGAAVLEYILQLPLKAGEGNCREYMLQYGEAMVERLTD